VICFSMGEEDVLEGGQNFQVPKSSPGLGREGKSAVSQVTDLLTAGKLERKGTYLKEVVVRWPGQWGGEVVGIR
jgi:hypothetical protein